MEYNEFDNFYHVHEGFTYNEVVWHSSEALYQSLKFKDQDYARSLASVSVDKAYSMGQSREYELIDDFHAKRTDLMFIANYEKYSQVPRLHKVLLGTGERLIEFYGSTPFWNKHNARILMLVRDTLR